MENGESDGAEGDLCKTKLNIIAKVCPTYAIAMQMLCDTYVKMEHFNNL